MKLLILIILTTFYFIFQKIFSIVFFDFFVMFCMFLGYSGFGSYKMENSNIIFFIIICFFMLLFLLTPFVIIYFWRYLSGKTLKKVNKTVLSSVILIMPFYFLYSFNISPKTYVKGIFLPVTFHIIFSIDLIFEKRIK